MLYFNNNGHSNNDSGLGEFYYGLALKEALMILIKANAIAYNPFAAFGFTPITTNNKIYLTFV